MLFLIETELYNIYLKNVWIFSHNTTSIICDFLYIQLSYDIAFGNMQLDLYIIYKHYPTRPVTNREALLVSHYVNK